jgi:hypothetical protein
MGFFSKLFGRSSETETAPARPIEEVQAECPHSTVTGRWDSVEDMGHEDRATKFVCESCQAEFTIEEMRDLRANSRLPITDPSVTDTVQSTRP